jgi:hypothetical protein
MTAIAATTTVTRTAPAFWLSLAALTFVTLALAVWLVARATAQGDSAVAPAHTTTGQYNQLCAPAPGTRYC